MRQSILVNYFALTIACTYSVFQVVWASTEGQGPGANEFSSYTYFGLTPTSWFSADIPDKRDYYHDPEDIYRREPYLVKPWMLKSLAWELYNLGDKIDYSARLYIDIGRYRKDLIFYNLSGISTLRYPLSHKLTIPVFSLLMKEGKYLTAGVGTFVSYEKTIEPLEKNPDISLSSNVSIAVSPLSIHDGDTSLDIVLLPTVRVSYDEFHLRGQIFVLYGRSYTVNKTYFRFYPRIQFGFSRSFYGL